MERIETRFSGDLLACGDSPEMVLCTVLDHREVFQSRGEANKRNNMRMAGKTKYCTLFRCWLKLLVYQVRDCTACHLPPSCLHCASHPRGPTLPIKQCLLRWQLLSLSVQCFAQGRVGVSSELLLATTCQRRATHDYPTMWCHVTALEHGSDMPISCDRGSVAQWTEPVV